ncbi:hypothetical protein GGTG_12048 [Gaeumannomyces tritici R3-111a-1]|uniref:Sulfatase N-terminal domain-containing protein n=1 Tax=Gaeumannomyces tritici (strain R3-111a-1) TaxID=644352 RepID=J3PEW9_GAET3|nr:hypothetical protein GGTG_12048 [Gaeumannomyces tritici R3-111a-1]EJT71027.1 hypothetical protein GGTG_12048 [Gaeumannomyces tritici R3-111a-1]
MRPSQSLGGLLAACAATAVAAATKPSIILIMSDDQDRRLGSTDFQAVLQREIFDKGVQFVNHFATTAQCCPSRASLLRGQATHNTNITHVAGPGGNYDKWTISGLDNDYLPHWLKKAGYRSEYIGKLLNGYNVVNAHIRPKGFDHIDALLDPYTTYYNVPVMSQNGERPVYYKGFHSTDVVRIKALDRLQFLLSQDQPYYLQIAPYSPHIQNNLNAAAPLARHMDLFPDAKAPRLPNYNPADEFQAGKGSWVGGLPLMNETTQQRTDYAYRRRAESLQGVDEIIEDVVAMLAAKGTLDTTYIIYTSDNGYHLGQHRIPAGKALFFGEDTNLPMAVRGPGIPQNVTSKIPSVHLDLVPTFLDIAGLPRDQWPTFLDGQSLLPQWQSPGRGNGEGTGDGNSRETLNVEFWGSCIIEAPNGRELGMPFRTTSYKTLRMLGDRRSWLLSVWCTGDVELYDTAADPHELTNLAGSAAHARVLDRLNALLLVTKSCAEGTCRDPWAVFSPEGGGLPKMTTMAQAMDGKYDAFFAGFPRVRFDSCMQVQDVANEMPFFPEQAALGLGLASRGPTDNYVSTGAGVAITDAAQHGGEGQRHATLEQVYANARELTDEEISKPPSGAGGE